jgi:acyl dehydratase
LRTFVDLDDLAAASGTSLGVSDWILIDQKRIDAFADATGDHQWIHVDPDRAKESAFGGTIAHGLLTLSLFPVLAGELYTVRGVRMGMNYGLNKVRYPAPVPSDSRVRLQLSVGEVTGLEGGAQVTLNGAFEIERAPKPACVFEALIRYVA